MGLFLILLIIQYFQNFKNILSQIHLLLTSDRENGKVFEKIRISGLEELKA